MSESHRARPISKAASKQNPFAEFLNPNSMITPGAAGAFTMVITNTLCQQFGQLPLNYTGLAVSFMFGAVVFGYGASLLTRAVYFLINSLIIFVVANGSNAIGVRISEPRTRRWRACRARNRPTARPVRSRSPAPMRRNQTRTRSRRISRSSSASGSRRGRLQPTSRRVLGSIG